tara:strand:- start:4677 stop:6914 length:2238 start_codon:yes stop_codon:yes gene_type:complete
LPESAESTKAAQLVEERFSTVSTDIPSIIVAQTKNKQKFTNNERESLKNLEEKIKASKDIPIKDIVSVFSLPEAKAEFESPSENTMTMIVNLSLGSFGDFDTIPDEVNKLRNIVSNETKSNENLTVLVGGPGGLFADLIKVFQSIDGLLLIVTVILVLVLLLIIYKSPITALIPLIVVGIVFQVSQGIIAWIDQGAGDFLKVNGQSTGIMTVVLFGSGTDYCLFISSRFKEELAKTKDKHEAMKKTMKGVGGAVTSAGFTIIVASSILLLCILKSYQSLGPVIGIAVFLMLIAALTLVPSLMCIMGKFSFFPVDYSKKSKLIASILFPFYAVIALFQVLYHYIYARHKKKLNKNSEGLYSIIAKWVINKPITTLIITCSLLLMMFTGLINAKPTYDQLASLPNNADSVKSFELLREGFNPGELAPVEIYIDFKTTNSAFKKENLDKTDSLTSILSSAPGITRITSPTRPFGMDSPIGGSDKIREYLSSNIPASFGIKARVNTYTSPDKSVSKIELVLNENPYDEKGMNLIPGIRNHIKTQGGKSGIDLSTIYVGGETAVQYDTREAVNRDQLIVLPIILLAIGLILLILLRSVIAPIYLCATIIFTYFATIGISLLVFRFIFDQPFYTSGLPFFLFVFLNALGVDYNIYLMSRIREEAKKRNITEATQIAVAKTGGVITSAGIILAGTFSALMVLPLTDLFQLGFAVAIGVIIDTFITRTLIVPAIVKLLGQYNWWPNKIIPSNK